MTLSLGSRRALTCGLQDRHRNQNNPYPRSFSWKKIQPSKSLIAQFHERLKFLQSLKCFTLCTIARGVAKANQLTLLKPGWADFALCPGFIVIYTSDCSAQSSEYLVGICSNLNFLE